MVLHAALVYAKTIVICHVDTLLIELTFSIKEIDIRPIEWSCLQYTDAECVCNNKMEDGY